MPSDHAARCRTAGEKQVTVVRSPRARANFFDLGDFEQHMDASYRRAMPAIAGVAAASAMPEHVYSSQ